MEIVKQVEEHFQSVASLPGGRSLGWCSPEIKALSHDVNQHLSASVKMS